MTDYQPGDIANGYQWTGTQWVPLVPRRKPREMPTEAWVLLACAGAVMLAGFLMWAWFVGGLDFLTH